MCDILCQNEKDTENGKTNYFVSLHTSFSTPLVIFFQATTTLYDWIFLLSNLETSCLWSAVSSAGNP